MVSLGLIVMSGSVGCCGGVHPQKDMTDINNRTHNKLSILFIFNPFSAKKPHCHVSRYMESVYEPKHCCKIDKNSKNVKDILYSVKEKAANHYIWFAAFSVTE
jgi:hypothetical protein